MKAASGDRVIREDITETFVLSSRVIQIIARGLRLKCCLWYLPVLKYSVVPYYIECIEGRGTQIESEECC